MANRAMFQTLSNLVERLTFLQGSWDADGSGAVANVTGSGIDSVTQLQVGCYKIKLQDAYDKLMAFEAVVEESAGTPVTLQTGLSNTTVYQITTLGTDVSGKSTFTISSGSGILQATIGGAVIQTTWASSDNASATAMAAAINANPTANALGVAVPSTNTVVFTARGLGVVSTAAAGTGFTVDHANTTGALSIAAQWQAVGLDVGVVPAVGTVFKSNSAGAQAGASATAAAGPVLGTATALASVANIVGKPSTTVKAGASVSLAKGGYFVVQFRSGIGVAAEPPAGRVKFMVFLRNSSVKGKGE